MLFRDDMIRLMRQPRIVFRQWAQKRGQEPIAKWPGGCCALLVPDPFSEHQVESQVLGAWSEKAGERRSKHKCMVLGDQGLRTKD